MKRHLLVLLVCVVFGIVGCGGGAGGTGGMLGDVGANTAVKSLTTDQKAGICERIRNASYSMSSDSCTAAAAISPGSYLGKPSPETPQAAITLCEEAKSACDASYASGQESYCENDPDYSTCILDDKSFANTCDLSIGVVVQCIEDKLIEMANSNSRADCTNSWALMHGDYSSINNGGNELSPACETWLRTCPSFGFRGSACNVVLSK